MDYQDFDVEIHQDGYNSKKITITPSKNYTAIAIVAFLVFIVIAAFVGIFTLIKLPFESAAERQQKEAYEQRLLQEMSLEDASDMENLFVDMSYCDWDSDLEKCRATQAGRDKQSEITVYTTGSYASEVITQNITGSISSGLLVLVENLDQQNSYSNISGTIQVENGVYFINYYSDVVYNPSFSVEVFADNRCVYSSGWISVSPPAINSEFNDGSSFSKSPKPAVIDFKADIAGASEVKIELSLSENGSSMCFTDIAISNFILTA